MTQYLWLIPIGFLIGAYGTLIGAGGGFVLVPVLLLLYPRTEPEVIASIALAVVFFNAASGSVAYARMRRIDYHAGGLFALATIPGAIAGALMTGRIPRRSFEEVFGVLLVATALYLLQHPQPSAARADRNQTRGVQRQLTERDGIKHVFSYNPLVGMLLSIVIGFLSSLLGIGGGIIHVPALVNLLGFPVHIATATSHFILAIMALTGTIVHVATGSFHHGAHRTICLSIGVLFGAQLGARWSDRVRGDLIIRGLALALGLVGARLLLTR